ncbi:hypothetical protein N7530_012359 [Penicillium desertorum]|uniref:Uncharacterized protein n=1 Tax=Penicillium desertorum TaxID=1303715 RepID=A0A9W9WF52_9EURO|nr:hypothetical protein N7530_012359 [Penicillium desertorum]
MDETASNFRAQWVNPSDLFSILLIIGGDVIAIAQAAPSGGPITPVTFSFGWVSEGRLMPPSPDSTLQVINLATGYKRFNRSWTLGRVFQNYEYWMPAEVRQRLQATRSCTRMRKPGLQRRRCRRRSRQRQKHPPNSRKFVSPRQAGLCISVYEWALDGRHPVGKPGHDWVHWLGIVVTVVQLGVSVIPFALFGDWSIFLVTVAGTILAYASGALPQWGKEKWACRILDKRKDIALTVGVGTQHVILVRGAKGGLDLEDMAGGQLPEDEGEQTRRGPLMRLMSPGNTTRMVMFLLVVLWLMLLLSSTGIQEHAWFLLAVSGTGMVQNLITAGAPRQPAMLGIPLRLAMRSDSKNEASSIPMVFAKFKIMHTLMELELDFKGAGRILLLEFFPGGGGLLPWEENWWSSDDPDVRRQLLRAAREKEFNKQMRRMQAG